MESHVVTNSFFTQVPGQIAKERGPSPDSRNPKNSEEKPPDQLMEDVVVHSSSDGHGGVCLGSIMAWNCRGAGEKAFSTLIRDIKKEFNASFCILLETHISGQRGEAV
ncbi:hypothetical protein Ahy_B01g056629 [Arachis hypogaea]|uniref:Uncharacterized protein n=1 Tax=Arachis hypogaea TaxID=3818 RepID=A0A445AZ66_ARAHY|nr:hypothetical protein Ahy_B01g056629 [Arachis hypogaea]